MALQSSGAISLLQIQTEFTGAAPISLSEYYRSGSYVSNTTPNANIPTSGAISFSNFYGGTAYTPTVRPAIGPITATPVYKYLGPSISDGQKVPTVTELTGPLYAMDGNYGWGKQGGWIVKRYENNILIDTVNIVNGYRNTKPVTITNPHPVQVTFYLRFEFGVMSHQNAIFEAYDITGQTWNVNNPVGTLLYSSGVLGSSTTSGPLTGTGQSFNFNGNYSGVYAGTYIPQNLSVFPTLGPFETRVFMGRYTGSYNGDYDYAPYYSSGLIRAVYGSSSTIIY